MIVYRALPELLHRAGLPVVFGLTGSSNVAWLGYGVQKGLIEFRRTRHEGTAVAAAAGYARASGRVGVASVTLGPGFANAVNALAAAVHQHAAVLLMVGESPSQQHFGLQNVEQRRIAEALGAGYHLVGSAAELAPEFERALDAVSRDGTPQVLSIPDDILGSETPLPDGRRTPLPDLPAPEPAAVAAAVDVLAAARRPLVLAGQGASLAGCRNELVELSRLCGARLATTLNVHRFFAGEPNDLGACGHSSPAEVLEQLHHTDAVLSVGASMNEFTTGNGSIFPKATIVQCEIDEDQRFVASAPELGLLGDAAVTLRRLIAEWRGRGLGPPPPVTGLPRRVDIRRRLLTVDLGHDPARGLDPRAVLATMDDVLPEDRIVVADGGRSGALLSAIVDARDGRSWISSRGHGSIGLGLGAALGAAAAHPDRLVTLFCGDAGFLMTAQELDAVRLNRAYLLIVVLDDGQHGSELAFLDAYGLPHDIARQDTPDLVALARAYGGDGCELRDEGDLEAFSPPTSGLFIARAVIDPLVNGRHV